jgi:hypothetical protein
VAANERDLAVDARGRAGRAVQEYADGAWALGLPWRVSRVGRQRAEQLPDANGR